MAGPVELRASHSGRSARGRVQGLGGTGHGTTRPHRLAAIADPRQQRGVNLIGLLPLAEAWAGILRGVDEAVSVTQSVGGELVGRSMGMWKALADLSEAGADVHALRDAYEALHAQFDPPQEVTVRPVSAGGVSSLLVSPPGDGEAGLLYLHGGGFMLGSAFGYRHLAGAPDRH